MIDPSSSPEGYCTPHLLDTAVVAQLRRDFADLDLPADHAFHATSANGSRQQARAVDQHLKAVLGPLLERVLPGYAPFLAAFISKGSRAGSVVDLHQDWTYTDERRHTAIIVWIPLVDTTAANGALHVVEGSHRWTRALRASGAEHATGGLQRELRSSATTVELPAGTALVYDPALVHGSDPNPTEQVRPAAAIALAPVDAPLVHFHVDDAGELTGWRIDESHYTTRPFASRPVDAEPVTPWDRLVEPTDLAGHLV